MACFSRNSAQKHIHPLYRIEVCHQTDHHTTIIPLTAGQGFITIREADSVIDNFDFGRSNNLVVSYIFFHRFTVRNDAFEPKIYDRKGHLIKGMIPGTSIDKTDVTPA